MREGEGELRFPAQHRHIPGKSGGIDAFFLYKREGGRVLSLFTLVVVVRSFQENFGILVLEHLHSYIVNP